MQIAAERGLPAPRGVDLVHRRLVIDLVKSFRVSADRMLAAGAAAWPRRSPPGSSNTTSAIRNS